MEWFIFAGQLTNVFHTLPPKWQHRQGEGLPAHIWRRFTAIAAALLFSALKKYPLIPKPSQNLPIPKRLGRVWALERFL